jgi:hypothetical protein
MGFLQEKAVEENNETSAKDEMLRNKETGK